MGFKTKILNTFRNGEIVNKLSFLKESQYWNREKQINYQLTQLHTLLNHASNNVPYYKELFDLHNINLGQIQTLDDLQRIPILTKEIIKKNFQKLLASNHKEFASQLRSTGGTTGVPLKYYSDNGSWNLHWALKYRAWEWGSYYQGLPIGILGGASIIPDKKPGLKRKIWNYLNGFHPLPSSNVDDRVLFDYVNLIYKHNINFLRGYPSSIATLANFCNNSKIKLNIKSVITTAELLRDEYKESILKAFDCTIIDTYGCADGGGNANTCEYDCGFHVSFEASIWEVCDEYGKITPEGELGELTLTSLTNFAMPLIRYQPGDIIENSFNYDICQCGRTLPRIKSIYGRSTDILTFSNNRTLGGPAFTLLFREFPLKKYQLIQNSNNSLDVNIVVDDLFNSKDESRLKEILEHHCGKGVLVNINILSEIQTPLSGKHRFIINNTNKNI